MAPEVACSLLGLRGDDDTPIDIESICEIMQQQAPETSQQQTVSSDAASTSRLSSILGGGSRNSGKHKRTADEQVVGKASIQPSAKRSVSAPGPTAFKEPSSSSRKLTAAALPSMLVSMSGAANNITTLINHMMMFQDNLVSQGAASIIQNIDYLSEEEQANLVLYFSNHPSVASTFSTLSPILLE
jgi:hypothetical protein